MRVLIAPDKFKGALSAAEVCETIAQAIREIAPQASIDPCPMADGGEGTGALLAHAFGADEHVAQVRGPRGEHVTARWWRHEARSAAIVELAQCAGLALIPVDQRNPLATTTFGVGELLRCAFDSGVSTILLCVGGSATVDGGAGILQALGVRFFDTSGAEILAPFVGADVERVARLEMPTKPSDGWPNIEILCDVDHVLLGPAGAAAVFGPQKGADAAGVARLERGLENWARVLRNTFGVDVTQLPHSGAAGGVPVGLIAAFGARAQYGFDRVSDAVGLVARIATADIVITGEGRLDAQTRSGKVVSGVSRLARNTGKPVIAFAGALDGASVALCRELGLQRAIAITPSGTPDSVAIADTRSNLRAAVIREASRWSSGKVGE